MTSHPVTTYNATREAIESRIAYLEGLPADGHDTDERDTAELSDLRAQLAALDDPDALPKIEQSVKVYLEWEDGTWRVASSTVDGYELDGIEDGSDCDAHFEHMRGDLALAHRAKHAHADETPLPDAEQLLRLLADALNYHLVSPVGAALPVTQCPAVFRAPGDDKTWVCRRPAGHPVGTMKAVADPIHAGPGWLHIGDPLQADLRDPSTVLIAWADDAPGSST